MKRVLVLGRDGMLGRMVTSVLGGSAALDVRATSRRDPGDPLRLDVRQPAALERVLDEQGPLDYVVNCVAIPSDDICVGEPGSLETAIQVNALFPHRLAAATASRGIRVVHVSTDAVFAREANVCYEDTTCAPADFYGKTKSLGEVTSTGVLTVRCSIVGPDRVTSRGLLEWLRSQPQGASVPGYTDHLWSGVTSLQFAEMCRALLQEGLFDFAASEGPIHHFCPNETLSKYALLELLHTSFRPDLHVRPVAGAAPPVRRVLATHQRTLLERFGSGRPMREAVLALVERDR